MPLMTFPFTREQFLGVFARYNLTVFPLQVLFVLLGLAAVVLVMKKPKSADRIVTLILSFFCLWIGIMYHILFFSSINPAAWGFGLFFIAEAVLLFWYGVMHGQVSFTIRKDAFSTAGIAFILYALVLYPLLGRFAGHGYPALPTFGLPCPTTIYMFGIFLMAAKKFPLPLLVVPVLWIFIGFFAALSLGITEDYFLLVAGISGTILIILKNRTFGADT
jgi:hypothetical protein